MKTSIKVTLGIGVLVVLAVAYYLISPAFIVVEKEEPFPETVEFNGMTITKDMVMDAEKMKEMIPEKEMMEDMPGPMITSSPFVAAAHEVEGKAILIQDGDKTIVRFENFFTINGPDLRIYLATDTSATDYIELSKIKATKGNVNYEVPSDVDISKYNHVLVWCKPFSVLFSYAVV